MRIYNLARWVGLGFFLILSLVVHSVASDEQIIVPTYMSVPDEIVIYEGNLAYARDAFRVYSTESIQVLLPKTVILRTVEIIDGRSKVGKFSFGTQSGQPLLKWKSKTEGERIVELSYLLTGVSWSPTYAMTILSDEKIMMRYNIGISNRSISLPRVEVKLVSGMVGEVEEGRDCREKVRLAQRAIAEYAIDAEISPIPAMGATRVNAYYAYDLGQQDIEQGEMTYITLLDKELEAEKEFVWVTMSGERVDVIYKVKNSSDEPFAQGLVETYQEGIYMGSDAIEWTPSGAKGHVTIGGEVDIKVKKTIDITEILERHHNNEFHHVVELKIENFGKKEAQLKVIDTKYRDCVDISFSIKPTESKAQTHMWEIKVPAGESKTIKYDFYSDSTYTDPYRSYSH